MRFLKFLNNDRTFSAAIAFLVLCCCTSCMVAAQTATTSISNPGFESGLAAWAPSGAGTIAAKVDSTRAHSGTSYLEVTAISGQHPVVFAAPTADTYIPVTTGDVLNFGGYAFRVSGDGLARFMLIAYDTNKANPKYISPSPNNAGGAAWGNLAGTYTVPSGIGYVRLYAEVYQPTTSTTVRFDDAVLTRTVTAPKTPTITWSSPADIGYGTALSGTQLNATASTSGSFTYSPAAGSVLNAGTQTLTATFTPTDTSSYTTATRSVTINVIKAASTITWANPADINYGTALGTTQLNATANTAGSFTYSPSAGTVLSTGTQTLTATFTPTDATNYTTSTKTVTINVAKATTTVSWANPADITYGTALSATQLNATANTAGSFTYSPSAGTVLNAGTQTLTATFTPSDLTNYSTATKTVTLNVAKAASTITWANPAGITYGTALSATQLNAAATTAGTFAYSPSAGTVLNAGSQTLTATFTPSDTTNYSTATKTVILNVTKAVSTITWASPADINYGTALSGTQLNGTANTAGSFTYTPSAGTVLNAGSQTLTATFTPSDTENYSTATKTVTLNVTKAASTITWATPAGISYGAELCATQLNATANTAGSFSYSPAAGTVLNAGAQTLTATFTPTDSTNYTSATKTVTINVAKATSTVSWTNPADITYGTALSATQLNASANIAGTFSYTPAAGTVLNAGTQTLTATFTPSDTANYSTATKTVTLNVAKAASTITWATPAGITYGTALSATQLNAASNTAGTFAYSPSAGTVLNAGSQTLTATFNPTDTTNYNGATKTVTISIAKATPTITWGNPADINYGTALSGVQLNATSSAAGTLAFTPAAGTILNAGVGQTLTVTFTPTDSNYLGATKTVTINVNKGTPDIAWANPADITYGTALSTTQLNATSSLPGKFAYSPATGTVLNVGTGQLLTTTFTPTDTTNYSTTTKSVVINVNAGASTNKLLLGIRHGDNGLNMTSLKDLEAWQGKKNAVVLTFTAWCNTSSYMDAMFGQQITNLWNNRNIPVITWEAYLCSNQTTPADIEGRAMNGEYDAYFTAWATRMKKWLAGPDGVYGTGDDRRAYLRMPHEMNGNWYPWSPTAAGEAPWQYAEMWRHIHNIFELQGIDSSHLQWMWIPNASGPYVAEDFYPGDAYVDWVGLDGYNFGTYSGGKWMTPAQRLDNMVGRLKLLTTKPIALVETGSSAYTSTGISYAAKDQWIKDVYTYASQKNIRMLMYFNKDVGADFTMFGGSEGNGTYTAGTATYKVFTGYKQAISPTWVLSSDPNNPRLLTDAQFAGQL